MSFGQFDFSLSWHFDLLVSISTLDILLLPLIDVQGVFETLMYIYREREVRLG